MQKHSISFRKLEWYWFSVFPPFVLPSNSPPYKWVGIVCDEVAVDSRYSPTSSVCLICLPKLMDLLIWSLMSHFQNWHSNYFSKRVLLLSTISRLSLVLAGDFDWRMLLYFSYTVHVTLISIFSTCIIKVLFRFGRWILK